MIELTGNAVEFFKLEATLAWGRVTGMVHPDQEPPVLDAMNRLWGGMTEEEQEDAKRRVALFQELFPNMLPKPQPEEVQKGPKLVPLKTKKSRKKKSEITT